MTQYALPVIDPNVTTGTDLANYLNSWKPAVLSQNAGAARPAYAVGGMLWVETVSASVWNLKLFGGTLDATIGTINPTTGVFTMGGTTFASLTVTGNTVLGDAPADTLTVNAVSTFAAAVNVTGGDLTVTRANAGGYVQGIITNSNNANAASHAMHRITVGGASAGDPALQLTIGGVIDWTVGIDNSDLDKLKIGPNQNVGTGTLLTLETSGIVIVNNGTLHVGSAAVSTGDCALELGMNRTGSGVAYLDLHSQAGTDYDARVFRGAGANAALALDNNGTGGILFTIAGVNFFHIGSAQQNICNRPMVLNGNGTNQALQIFDLANPSGAQVALYGSGATTPNKFIRAQGGLFDIVNSSYTQQLFCLDDAGRAYFGAAPTATTGFSNGGDIIMPVYGAIRARSAFSVWARFDSAGTISRSLNVTSVTKNSLGNFTVNIAAGVMADGAYGYFVSARQGATVVVIYAAPPTPTATAFSVQCVNHLGAAVDPGEIMVGILP